ncbi:MAG: CHAD domain-containing protein [Acidobacteriia bacterium]|nr:CHAD domain-containing protein [Terriglobia bacterium]
MDKSPEKLEIPDTPSELDAPLAEQTPAAEPAAEFAEPVEPWRKVRALAYKQLDRFLSYEPKVLRGDDPDAIHDMRVASRRLQQILDLLYANPRPREVRRLRWRIRRCRRALGDVRNCDVLLAHIHQILARKRAARREAWTAVHHYLRARRAASFLRAMRKLSKINLAVFYVRMRRCLGEAATLDSPRDTHATQEAALGEPPAARIFPEQIARALDTVWSAFTDQIELSHRDPRAPVIHGVRIAAKRLRYLLEVVHEFDVAGSGEALAWLRQLQQHLGDWHDREILEQMMVEMIARPELLREQLPLVMEIEKLILRNRDAKREFERKYYEMTSRSSEMQRLNDWAAYLLASPSAALARA